MKSKIVIRALARLGQVVVSSSSRLMVAKKDSASALSQHCPVRPGQAHAELCCQGGELLAGVLLGFKGSSQHCLSASLDAC